jgi:hypothetical protein
MGKRYRKRRKRIVFRKIKLSRNAKMWIYLGVALAILFFIAWIAKLEILGNLAAGLVFTAPILLARYQFVNGDFFERTSNQNAMIYVYVAVMFLINFCPSVKIRWILSFTYLVACGIYLILRVKGISLKHILDDGDSLLLIITEIFMILIITAFSVTTERNALSWILMGVFSLVLFLPIAYLIGKELSISLVKKIGIDLCVLFLIFVFCGKVTAGLNYSLDFSEPTVYTTRIDKKEYHNTSGKGPTTHSFTVYMDGKLMEIEVTFDIYKKYNTGDNIDVNIHKGILGMTYYTVN